ncbi:MAG TPA: 2,3-bisphosphoglycerate-dependent phosphoglycerate mutase [Gammaproteobacteria bacterium]|nr:2,3-bisphosphoglycerate-dependent phosphoglycerate mutase [Gammaproteobacteria bacterium]HIB75485.1 2,3-bisphosphoglycerate-dependent phosphoglycerate mutase [Gammaproteobacteria bacterium]
MASLVLVRHGQSQWNEKNLFTGWKDPDLTEKGEKEAVEAGLALKESGYKFDIMFTSVLLRAKRTGKLILEQMGQEDLKTFENEALNERNYGDLAGLNKDDARKKWGEDQVHKWRRSFDIAPPGGESLKMTAERVLPYFEETILPLLKEKSDILVAAHGNSLRALVMQLDKLNSDEVVKLEIPTGMPICYSINEHGQVKNKVLMKT